jgi:hypothetical protein
MAYLGYNGIVTLQRTQPEPIVVPASAVNKTSNFVAVGYDDWLFAEHVYLIHAAGSLNGYIHRDSLDRIYFHQNIDGALSNSSATLISLSTVNVTKPVVLVCNSNSTQRTTLGTFITSLSTISSETRLRAWPSTNNSFKSQATENPFKIQGELRRWQLSRTASEIDTGVIGERFGSYVKATVTGSGTMDFIVNLYSSANKNDVDPMLRLVQLTEQGSSGSARFYLKQATVEVDDADTSPVTSSLFFQSSILITTCAVDVDNSDIVTGSASFVTTGPIRLLSS